MADNTQNQNLRGPRNPIPIRSATETPVDRRIVLEECIGEGKVQWWLAWSRISAALQAWWSGAEYNWITPGLHLPEKCKHETQASGLVRWCEDCGLVMHGDDRIGIDPPLYRALMEMKDQVDMIAVYLRENYAEEIRRGEHNGRPLAEIIAAYLGRERRAQWKLQMENKIHGGK